MNEKFKELINKIYASNFYERLANLQNRTVSKWQTLLLRNPAYWKWTSYKYSNSVHWGLLFGLAIGLFVGIMLPIAAPKQPGRGQEFEFTPPSSVNSRIIITPNLLNTGVVLRAINLKLQLICLRQIQTWNFSANPFPDC